MKIKVKALIPVRMGSERVKGKALRPFAGTTLLERKLDQLNRIKRNFPAVSFEGVVVNSESREVLDIATSLGAEAVKRRPGMEKGDTPMDQVWRSIAEDFDADVMVYCPVTSPTIRDSSILRCVELYNKEDVGPLHSVTTVHRLLEHLWIESEMTVSGYRPYNYDPSAHVISQNLPGIVKLTWGCTVVSREQMIKHGRVHVDPLFVQVDTFEAMDIDWPADFYITEALVRSGLV